MRLFDVTLILNDMEHISGVQEALSAAISGPGNPKTATEANIQQSGTNARTTSIETVLNGCLRNWRSTQPNARCKHRKEVQKMAGPDAMWPGPDPTVNPPVKGMSIEDLFNLVEISIAAGTTGKPRQDRSQAWATILPLIRELIGQIERALGTGNKPLADALTNLIKETMFRFGDESDVDRFVPKIAPPGSPGRRSAARSFQSRRGPLRGELTPSYRSGVGCAGNLRAPAPGAPAGGAPEPRQEALRRVQPHAPGPGPTIPHA